MKNPFNKLSRKVKERLLIVALGFALGHFGVPVSETAIMAGVDLFLDVSEELAVDEH